MTDRLEWNRQIIEEFRANEGRVAQFGQPLLLLTHTGARTGQEYTSPVAYLADGDRFVVFAANGGRPQNPGWYHNLVAHPEVTVEVGTERFAATATLLDGDERERVWARHITDAPDFAGFQARAGRPIPVIALLRAGD
jgi:deazaflavin-dependent oxidoreductase (nitroreductase family)